MRTNEEMSAHSTPTIADSPWPPELDALIAAPEHHTLVFENAHVRVLETRIPPGERTAVHTHCWPATQLVKSASHVVRYNGNGQVIHDSRQAGPLAPDGTIRWGDPLPPHSLENVGTNMLHVVSVEIKTRP